MDNSPMPPVPYIIVKTPIARKSLHQFSEVLDIKQKNALCRLGSE